MLKYFALAATTALVFPSSLFAQSANIFEEREATQLDGQDIDANVRLLEALSRAAKKGPKFRVSPDKVFIETVIGETAAETVRISNVGDEDGAINGVNPLGSIDGLSVTDNCPGMLPPGGFCDIAIRFNSDLPQNVQSVVIATIKERNRSSFDIPLQIQVSAPIAEEPAGDPVEPDPVPVVIAQPDGPKGPSSRDIASRYFNAVGVRRGSPKSGFVTVSLPDELKQKQFSGVRYSDIGTRTEVSDERYSDQVASTEASLPVNRDMILTADRVVKAVLETPVSNVMCGKVVAVVESDVYSATSDMPLIQAGSRAIGRCGEFADERVGIAWNRIITTDGRSIEFDDGMADTADASGLGGGLGRVYRSNFDRFVLPIFSTVIDAAAGVIFATFGEKESVVTTGDGTVVKETSPKNEGLRIVTGEARDTSQELIAEIRDVREVMVLPAGSRIDIELSQDVYFKNEREIVRLGDTRYVVESAEEQKAREIESEKIGLAPYRKGMDGPVVTVDGRRYVVVQQGAEEEDGSGVSRVNPVITDLQAGQGDK